MTNSDIESLITYLQHDLPKSVFSEHFHDGEKMVEKGSIYCKVTTLFDVLRNYPVEPEKTCGPGEGKVEVTLVCGGDVTPLSSAKAIIDTGLFTAVELGELAEYLKVYLKFNVNGGFQR